jgi:hypothetical protein
MKKMILGVAVTAALAAGSANAAITLVGGKPVINPADTFQVFLSGASASRVFIEQSMVDTTVPVANRLCTGKVYKFQDNGNGTNQNAYLCVGNTANPTLAPLLAGAKKNILLYKRSAGGSAMGVSPIVNEALTSGNIAFLKLSTATTRAGVPNVSLTTNCTLASTSATIDTYTCVYTEGTLGAGPDVATTHPSSLWTKPDFGVSDVDPGKFVGSNVPAGFTAVTSAGLATLQVKAAFSQNFGIITNVAFRNALQAAQGKLVGSETAANQPTLTTAQVASILKGTLPAPLAGSFPAMPAGKSLHICGRTNGSGTKAQASIKFLRYPCGSADSIKKDTGTAPNAAGVVLVHQMNSSGDLDECMAELNAGTNTVGTKFNNIWGTAYAIGYQGTENNANNSKAYRFIKVNAKEPTLLNVYNSNSYIDWVESTFQYNKTATSHLFATTSPLYVANKRQLVDEMIKQIGNPVVIGKLNTPDATHTWGQSGFMATPVNWVAPLALNQAAPVNRFSHATRSPALPVNDCKVPTLY